MEKGNKTAGDELLQDLGYDNQGLKPRWTGPHKLEDELMPERHKRFRQGIRNIRYRSRARQIDVTVCVRGREYWLTNDPWEIMVYGADHDITTNSRSQTAAGNSDLALRAAEAQGDIQAQLQAQMEQRLHLAAREVMKALTGR